MTDDSLLGQQLDEYRLEMLLGRGGMARVYRGLDRRLGRYAAVKVIDTPLRSDSEYIVRFEREAQAIARLDHPHIVRLYHYGEAQGLLYMAMQYVEGADLGFVLQTYRDDGEFIEPEEASRIIRQVCQALDYAHAHGVIHRDIKPSNIMLDKQGQVYLTDFGLALLTEIGTRGEIFGSPHYIAPEQAVSSAGAVPQSDLYSVGIILYEMRTGQPPFDADTALDIAMMHLSDPPPPPRELRPEISAPLENVILKILAKEPGERYPNGAALADALDQALAHPETKALTPIATTLPHKSIPERVALEVLARSLPPLPAEVATPRQAPTLPRPFVAPPPPVSVAPVRRNTRVPLYVGTLVGLVALGLILLAAVLFLLSAGDDNGEDSSTRATGTGEAALSASPRELTETASGAVALTETAALPAPAIPTETVTHSPAFTPTVTLTPALTPLAQGDQVTVPDVTGLGIPAAAALLNRNGMALGLQSEEPWTEGSIQPAGTIFAQSLAPGATVAPGTALDVTVLRSPNMLLIYSPRVITLINQADAALNLRGLVFNALDGNTTASFPAANWMAALDGDGRCAQLWAEPRSAPEKPAECADVQRWMSTANTSAHFWTGTNGVTRFNVVYDGVERAICEGATRGQGRKECAFFLPAGAAGGDTTAYVYLAYTTDRLIVLNQSADRWMPLSGIIIYNYNPNVSVPGAELPVGDPTLFGNPDTVGDITRLAPGQCLLYSNSNQDAAYPPQDCDVIARLDINPGLIFWAANFEVSGITDSQRRACPAATEGKLTICIMPR